MVDSSLLVTCPMLSVRRRVIVDGAVSNVNGTPSGGTTSPKVVRTEIDWVAGAFDVAKAARLAGASVTWLSLVEPDLEASVRAELEGSGIVCDLVSVPAASRVQTQYVDEAGKLLFEVSEERMPSIADVDHLLDRAEKQLAAGASFAVAAGDLVGASRVDFMERIVGRAWGFGVKTICVETGPSLKQAFHTEPFAALVPADELTKVSPPDQGVEETEAETLARIFEDAVRLLIVTRDDGSAIAVTRAETRSLGALNGIDPAVLMGAVAARLVVAGDKYLEAVEEGIGILRAEA